MEKDIDYIYEFSDLNWMHTRVKILTGELKGLIFEFGGSSVAFSQEEKATMSFDYTLYALPENAEQFSKMLQSDFNKFVSDLILDISKVRQEDIENHTVLLQQAAAGVDCVKCNINIDSKFYTNRPKSTETINGLQSI